MFLERLSDYGMDTSPYYQDKKFNKGKGTINDLPNCVQYAVCRTYEACQTDEPFVMFAGRTAGGYPNAKDFYHDTVLPKGTKIRNGSIACFDGTNGHVAFVERVIDDTHALITQSQYDPDKSRRDYKYWEKREVELIVGKATLSGVGALQGFIYLPIHDIRKPREPNTSQISIEEDMVNVRLSPNGNVAVRGCYCPMGTYDIVGTFDDEYRWYRLEKNRWVRDGEWLKYLPIEDDEIERLTEENRQLRKENEILLGRLHEIHILTEEV